MFYVTVIYTTIKTAIQHNYVAHILSQDVTIWNKKWPLNLLNFTDNVSELACHSISTFQVTNQYIILIITPIEVEFSTKR